MINLYTLIAMYHSYSIVFMTNNIPNDMKKHCESTEPKSHQMAKIIIIIFFFFF